MSAAAAAMLAATLLWRLLTFSGFSNDHYAHLALAQQMLLGDRPVRDFLDPGWPLTYLLSAAAWRAAGDAMAVEWTIAATGLALGAAFTVVAAHRLSGSIAIAVLAALFELLIYPRTYAYPKILAYAAFAWLVTAGGPLSRRRLIGFGLLVAGAFLLRHDHGIWIGAATVAYVWLASRRDGPSAALRRAGIAAAAAAAAALPWLIYIAASGGIAGYVATALEYARSEANASVLDAWPGIATADGCLFWIFWGLPAASALVVIRRWRRGDERWPGELAAVGALVVLAAGVNAGFLRDVLRTRVSDASVPAVVLGAWLLGLAWGTAVSSAALRLSVRAGAAAVVMAAALAMAQVAELGDQVERTNVSVGLMGVSQRFVQVARLLRRPHRQEEAPPSRFAAALMPFFGYLDRCTSAADRLIVTGASPDIIVLAGRPFASDGVTFGQWYSSASNQDRTLEKMRRQPALFVVVIDEPDFRDRFSAIARYVDDQYRAFTEVRGDGVTIPILVDRDRTPRGDDADTGWPCFR